MTALPAEPDTETGLAAAISDAASHGQSLSLQGRNTKRGLGRAVNDAGAVVSLAKFSGVTLYEPAELVLSAKAGTPVAEIEALLDKNNQMLAFEPPDYAALLGTEPGQQSIGGVVSCNLSGPRRIYAGAARDLLIGTRAVNGRGEIIRGGGRVMKNVTGLDIPRVLAGSYGTLAAITETTFKVLPRGETAATLALDNVPLADASAVMAAAVTSPYEISAAAWLPAAMTGAVGNTGLSAAGEGVALLRLENFETFIKRRSAALIELLNQQFNGLEVASLGAPATRNLWRAVGDVQPLVGEAYAGHAIWRLSVPPVEGGKVLAALIAGIEGSAGFLDWSGGLIWLAVPAARLDASAATIREAIASLCAGRGGRATLIRASAEVRARLAVFDPPEAPVAALNRRLKASFDPHGLFNPGRLHPDL
jgi:glycolate oxidase FAD binding subunit